MSTSTEQRPPVPHLEEDVGQAYLALTRDLVCTVDASGRITSANEAWAHVLGHDPHSLIGTPSLDQIHPEDVPFLLALAGGVDRPASLDHDCRVRAADGTYRLIRWSIVLAAGGTDLVAVGHETTDVRSVEDRARIAEADAERQALTDPLTLLHNRQGFGDGFRRRSATALATRRPLAFALVRLDGLPLINERRGLAAGDEALRQTAAALTRHARGADLVARWGDAEFAVLLVDTSVDEALLPLHRAQTELDPTAVEGRPAETLALSAGVIDARGFDLDEAAAAARQRLLAARRAGPGAVEGVVGPLHRRDARSRP